jgi:hypothetical protein
MTTCSTLRFLLFMISVLPVTHGPTFFPPVLVYMVIPKSHVEFMRFRKKILTIGSHTCEPQALDDSHLVTYDRRQITCVLLSAESRLIRFYMDEYSRCSTALASYITLLRSFVFACPEQCHGRAVFIGDDLAIHGGPCSCPPHGQGDMVVQLE